MGKDFISTTVENGGSGDMENTLLLTNETASYDTLEEAIRAAQEPHLDQVRATAPLVARASTEGLS